jgi:hypothetical protein
MRKQRQSNSRSPAPPALIALRRAAKKAVELARRMGTPAYVLENGKIVDIARPRTETNQKKRRKRKHGR